MKRTSRHAAAGPALELRHRYLESPSTTGRVGGRLLPRASRDMSGVGARVSDARHGLFSVLAAIAAWEVAGRALQYTFLPPFSSVVKTAVYLFTTGQILGYLATSLISLVVGYGLAVTTGALLGLLMGRYRWVEYAFEIYIYALLATPKIVFIPVLYALFGVGRGTQVAVVFLSVFSIIVINTMNGIRTVGRSEVEMARAFGASERQLLAKVLLPGALPLVMAGLRVGIGRAVKGMIRGEMFIALIGLGALLRRYGNRFDSEKVLAIVLMVVGVGIICTSAVQTIERRVIAWMDERK